MKHLKTATKHILAVMLVFAVMLTSVVTGDIITAYAAGNYYAEQKEDIYDIKDTVITVKPGDAINIKYMSNSYTNGTRLFNWTSSDESVATLHVKYGIGIESPAGYDIDPLDIERVRAFLEINSYDVIALKPGTTVITATDKGDPSYTHSFTLKVKAPKKTAKQKKCKNHKWVTTKKATCCRPGVRTCKKCKLQKVTPVVDHKYKTETVTTTLYPSYVAPACEGCNTVFDPLHYDDFEYVEDNCITEESYNEAFDAAMSALREHKLECEGYKDVWDDVYNQGQDYMGNWFAAQLHDYSHPYEQTRKETKCKYCGFYKEWIEEIFTGE